MATDAFEEQLQFLGALFDEFVAESVSCEVFQSVLVWEGSDHTGGEVSFKAFTEEGKVVESTTGGHVGAGEVREVGFGTNAV